MAASKQCIKVAVTGAAGQIAYSLLPLIASGRMLGPDQHVQLNLLDIESALKVLEGVQAELMDCAFPLLDNVIISHEPKVAFHEVNVAIMCGSFPRKPGMDRRDLLTVNDKIFAEQGRMLGEVAAPDCRICVVGNPANTNALILLQSSNGKLNPKHVTALTRLDHNRCTALIAEKCKTRVENVKNCIIWGNHSNTQVPDVDCATVQGTPARQAVKDDAFLDGPFFTTVQQRGAQIINLRGLSSAMSAAKAISDHMHDWMLGTPEGSFVSMSVFSDGNPFDIPAGLIFSFPVTCRAGEWEFAAAAKISPHATKRIEATTRELQEEREQAVAQ